jgi:hypothetical protein
MIDKAESLFINVNNHEKNFKIYSLRQKRRKNASTQRVSGGIQSPLLTRIYILYSPDFKDGN